uniref:Uncharacterized protein n=1 Tax=Seriola lalandi dorsalis TaxID=1841481 RepID=A0A3B4WSB5_SERLL
ISSKLSLLLQIHELGNPKAKKPDDVPMFYEVMEPAKVLLDAGEEIPCDLMSKILKFQLLQIKANDQQRRESEQLQLGSRIFEGVASLIYDCLDWRRQHQHYLDNIKLFSVPTVVGLDSQPKEVAPTPLPMTPRSKKKSVREEKLPPLSTDVDMRYYDNLLNLVPPEACSVPLILHCMLEQVCLCMYMCVCLVDSFSSLVQKSIYILCGFDPAEVELSMMKLSPVWELIHSAAHPRKSYTCWMAVKQQLQHYCTDDAVSWPEVERLFHQSVFETMPLTRLDQKGVLLNTAGPQGSLGQAQQQTATIIPWDDPLSYAKQQLHDLRTKGMFPKEQGMLVRQSFPLHGRGELRQLQDPALSKELSRNVTSQGTVIRYMRDGSTEVHIHTHTHTHIELHILTNVQLIKVRSYKQICNIKNSYIKW